VEQISLNRQVVGFSGSSDEVSLANLTEAFRARPDFGEVAVERVAKKGSSLQVDFALKATYIPKAKKTL
jgi:hypothetical protein